MDQKINITILFSKSLSLKGRLHAEGVTDERKMFHTYVGVETGFRVNKPIIFRVIK
jgi:hypothetical protein